jgi:hypothetical protein
MRFGLADRFTDHFTTRLETINNYNATANLHILHIIAANTKYSPACSIFTSRFLLTAPNGGDSSAFALTSFPTVHRLASELSSKPVPLITLLHRRRRKYSSSVVACVFTAPLRRNGRGADYRKQSSIVACVYVAGVT